MAVTIGTDSYGDETGLTAYATTRGLTLSEDETELLIKAMDYLESLAYKGNKWDRDQDLKQPRTWYDYDNGDDPGEVPNVFVLAQYECATLIDQGYSFNPVIERQIKREKVDVIEVEYMDNAMSSNYYPSVDLLISKYLLASGTSFNVFNS